MRNPQALGDSSVRPYDQRQSEPRHSLGKEVMNMLRMIALVGLVLATGLGLAFAQGPSKLEVTIKVPADVPSFKGQTLEVQLFEFDPKIADKPAEKFDQAVIKDFSHEQGKETVKEVTLGEKAKEGKTTPMRSYYTTVFVLKNGVRSHIGEQDGKKGTLCRVFAEGKASKVTMVLRPVQ
jgi:hypothetical protein